MKWYFCIESIGYIRYESYLKAAVISCRKNTSLTPILIWYEANKHVPDELRTFLDKYGVKLIHGEGLVFNELMKQREKIKITVSHSTPGAYLRFEIPLIEQEDEYVLYGDCDIMFNKEIELDDVKPRFIACAPEFQQNEWGYFNSGVMVMNIKNMRNTLDNLIDVTMARMRSGFCMGSDQGDLNGYYFQEWTRLNPLFNWKPYWGVNEDAKIIHFHGPKPDDCAAIINGLNKNEMYNTLFFLDFEAYKYYLVKFIETLGAEGVRWVPKYFGG
jgi:hypothetical protein